MVTPGSKAHNKGPEKTRTAAKPVITKRMLVADILALCPDSEPMLAEYGLSCFHCSGAELESLEDGCRSHAFETEEIDELVDDLNTLIADMPARPQTLEVTLSAAHAIRDVAEGEKKTGEGLAVIVDGHGGFCMEFKKDPDTDEKTFVHQDAPDVRIFASIMTLYRIGGATIDFRDGRFKLDLAEDSKAGCGCGGSCSCK